MGDVAVAGEWTQFQPLDELGVLGQPTNLYYAGTSYAAPVAALFVASDMAAQGACTSPQPLPALTTDATGAPIVPPADEPLGTAAARCVKSP